MARQGVAWNKSRTKSVVLSKLKEFTITAKLPQFENSETIANNFDVRGWFNQENSFLFGEFYTRGEAEEFLESIHSMF